MSSIKKAIKNVGHIKSLINPFKSGVMLKAMLPIFMFGLLLVAIFFEWSAVKIGISIGIVILLPIIVILEKFSGYEKDYDLNSIDFQLALVMTAALSTGIAIGYDPEQVYNKVGQYFLLINIFITIFSVISVIDNVRIDYEDNNPPLKNYRINKLKRIIFRFRTKFFMLIFSIYLIIPLIIGVIISFVIKWLSSF